MSRRHDLRVSRKASRSTRRTAALQALKRASESALKDRTSIFEPLESRTLFTIVQPAGQDFLAFEAEDPQATFTDIDSDGYNWTVIKGQGTQGNTTLPSNGAALQARRDPAGGATNDEGQVDYPIQLTSAGPYFFYARTKYTASGGDNSMYVPANGGDINADPTVQWDNRTDSIGDYHWNNLDNAGNSFKFNNPTPGAPTDLKLNIRENGYIVDKIVLSTTAMTPAQLDALSTQSVIATSGPVVNQATVLFTPVTGATSYNILRGTAVGGPFTQVGTATGTATSFIDTTVPAGSSGQTFFYTVQPVTASGPGTNATPAAGVIINQGVLGSYYNDNFWGGGGRGSVKYNPTASPAPVVTFRPGQFPDVQTIEPNVDYDWGNGSPNPAIRGDNHSTVHTGKVTIPADVPADKLNADGTVSVTFIHSSDDDGILFVNGQEAANDMGPPGHGQADKIGTPMDLLPGHSYDFIQLQAEQGGGSGVRFRWINPTTGLTEAVPGQYLNFLSDVPAAPSGVTAGVVADATAGMPRMVTFTFTDNATSETRFELLRDGVVVGNAPMDNNGGDLDGDATNGNQVQIVDAQPLPGSHTYAVRAVNFDGASAAVAAPAAVTVPADYFSGTGASAYYFNSGSWNGGRIGGGLGGTEDRVLAGMPDYAQLTPTVDSDYGTNSPIPGVIEDDYFSTVNTGKVTIPADFNGNGTSGETIAVQFVGNTDDHGMYFVNGQLAAVSFVPRGQGDYTGAGPITLKEGQSYDFTIFQAEQGGGAGVHLKWVNPGAANATQVVPTEDLNPRTGAPSAAPSAVAVTGTTKFINVHFTDNATNEVRYEIERAEVTGGTPGAFSLVGYAPVNGDHFNDTTAQAGKTYRYRVTAVNFEGRSTATTGATDASLTATEPQPFNPTNGSGQLVLNRVNLQFTDNAVNEANYTIQRKLTSAPDTAFAAIPGSPFVFNGAGQTGVINIQDADPTLVPGSLYTYRVIAVGSNGLQSAPLDINVAVTPAFRTTFTNAEYPGAGPEVIRGDSTFDYGWGTGRPDPLVSPDTFHTWVEGTYTAPVAGDYVFSVVSDDGQRLFIDGNLAVDNWALQGDTRKDAAPVTLTAGQVVELRYEQFEQGGGATGRLEVTPPGGSGPIPVVASGGPVDATPLRAPIQVSGTATIGGSVRVHWLDTTANETGFQILRASAIDGTYTQIGQVGKDAQYYFDNTSGATADTTYFYEVRAVKGATQGPLSDPSPDAATPTGTTGGDVNFTDFSDPATEARWTLLGKAVFADRDADPNATTEVLRLTANANSQTSAAYLTDVDPADPDAAMHPRKIDGFQAGFDFIETPGSGDPADGFTFILGQNPAGLGGGGGAMGWVGVGNAFAVKFDIYPGKLNQIGIYHNGIDISDDATDPRNRSVPIALDFESGHKFHTDLNYNAGAHTFTVTISDVTTPATAPYTATWSNIDIPTMVQSGTAFVGFTGATGGENMVQDISAFSYKYTPAGVSSTIDAVYVRGSTWAGPDANPANTTFGEFLAAKGLGDATYGFRVDNLPVDTTVPWINVNQVVLHYSSPLTAGGLPTPGSVVLDGQLSDYTVTAVTQLDPQTVALTLDRALGIQPPPATDPTQGDRVTITVPNAGPGGTAYTTKVAVLQGDADRAPTHRVNAIDLGFVKARANTSTNDTATTGAIYTAFADLNGSGRIDAIDLGAAKARNNDALPPAAAVASLFSEKRIADEVLA